MIRDTKGRFTKESHNSLTAEEKIKISNNLKKSWKNRKDYVGDLIQQNPYIYNSWRSFMFTKKGQKIGHDEKWNNFKSFFNDVFPYYEKGKVFRRKNNKQPFGPNNFMWVTKDEAALLHDNTIYLTYDGKTLAIKEWANELGTLATSIKNRYHSHKDWPIEWILKGKPKKHNKKTVKDATNQQEKRNKASKMISSYKIKDKKIGVSICDMTIDWFIENIMNKPCHYCGDTHRIGADRIDNSKGHIRENVVPCCYECNCARNNNFTVEEMEKIGKVIKEIKEKRNHQQAI